MLWHRFVLPARASPGLPELLRQQCCGLSSAQVTTALRPFYFLVHPDLFAQHPRAQHINDASLKVLNNHIDLLINDQRPSPVSLQFYIRNKKLEGLLSSASSHWINIYTCSVCMYRRHLLSTWIPIFNLSSMFKITLLLFFTCL